MTFQIGMVGSDGVLLASDLKRVHEGLIGAITRFSSEQPKIHIFHSGLAYCCAGDEFAEVAARKFCEQADNLKDHPQIHSRLIESGEYAIRERASSRDHGMRQFASILFAIRSAIGRFELWCLDLNWDDARGAMAEPVCGKRINGDQANAAGFFVERYFRRGRPVQELTPLAAHTILVAHVLNTAGIDGLEIIRCTAEGCKKVSQDEIETLTERSRKLDAHIGACMELQEP